MNPPKRPRTKPNPRLADSFLPDIGRRWPRIAKEIHRECWFFGLHGCYASNKTLAQVIGCDRRSIMRNRRLLELHEAIYCQRSLPCTWSMWAVKHPSVIKRKTLYFKGGSVINPYCQVPPSRLVSG